MFVSIWWEHPACIKQMYYAFPSTMTEEAEHKDKIWKGRQLNWLWLLDCHFSFGPVFLCDSQWGSVQARRQELQ